MHLGMIGLGGMGPKMTERLMKAGTQPGRQAVALAARP